MNSSSAVLTFSELTLSNDLQGNDKDHEEHEKTTHDKKQSMSSKISKRMHDFGSFYSRKGKSKKDTKAQSFADYTDHREETQNPAQSDIFENVDKTSDTEENVWALDDEIDKDKVLNNGNDGSDIAHKGRDIGKASEKSDHYEKNDGKFSHLHHHEPINDKITERAVSGAEIEKKESRKNVTNRITKIEKLCDVNSKEISLNDSRYNLQHENKSHYNMEVDKKAPPTDEPIETATFEPKAAETESHHKVTNRVDKIERKCNDTLNEQHLNDSRYQLQYENKSQYNLEIQETDQEFEGGAEEQKTTKELSKNAEHEVHNDKFTKENIIKQNDGASVINVGLETVEAEGNQNNSRSDVEESASDDKKFESEKVKVENHGKAEKVAKDRNVCKEKVESETLTNQCESELKKAVAYSDKSAEAKNIEKNDHFNNETKNAISSEDNNSVIIGPNSNSCSSKAKVAAVPSDYKKIGIDTSESELKSQVEKTAELIYNGDEQSDQTQQLFSGPEKSVSCNAKLVVTEINKNLNENQSENSVQCSDKQIEIASNKNGKMPEKNAEADFNVEENIEQRTNQNRFQKEPPEKTILLKNEQVETETNQFKTNVKGKKAVFIDKKPVEVGTSHYDDESINKELDMNHEKNFQKAPFCNSKKFQEAFADLNNVRSKSPASSEKIKHEEMTAKSDNKTSLKGTNPLRKAEVVVKQNSIEEKIDKNENKDRDLNPFSPNSNPSDSLFRMQPKKKTFSNDTVKTSSREINSQNKPANKIQQPKNPFIEKKDRNIERSVADIIVPNELEIADRSVSDQSLSFSSQKTELTSIMSKPESNSKKYKLSKKNGSLYKDFDAEHDAEKGIKTTQKKEQVCCGGSSLTGDFCLIS